MSQATSDIPLSLAHLSELDVPAARAGRACGARRLRVYRPAHPRRPRPAASCIRYRTEAEQAEMRRRLADNGIKVLEVEMVPLSSGRS